MTNENNYIEESLATYVLYDGYDATEMLYEIVESESLDGNETWGEIYNNIGEDNFDDVYGKLRDAVVETYNKNIELFYEIFVKELKKNKVIQDIKKKYLPK